MSTSGTSGYETSLFAVLCSSVSESLHTDTQTACGATHGDIKLAGQPLSFIAPPSFLPPPSKFPPREFEQPKSTKHHHQRHCPSRSLPPATNDYPKHQCNTAIMSTTVEKVCRITPPSLRPALAPRRLLAGTLKAESTNESCTNRSRRSRPKYVHPEMMPVPTPDNEYPMF